MAPTWIESDQGEILTLRRWATEYHDLDDGDLYAGPIVLADCIEAAQAVVSTTLLGPHGEELMLAGELVKQSMDGDEISQHIRVRVYHPSS